MNEMNERKFNVKNLMFLIYSCIKSWKYVFVYI